MDILQKTDHNTGNYMPYSLQQVCGFFYVYVLLRFFLTNRPLLWDTPTVFPSLVRSDHLAVLVPPRMTIKPVRRTVYFRDVREHHKIKMDNELQHMDWSDILSSDDPSESVITLNNKLWSTFDKCFPMKRIRMSSRDPPTCLL